MRGLALRLTIGLRSLSMVCPVLAGLWFSDMAAVAQAPRQKVKVATRQEAAAPALTPGQIDPDRSRVYVHVDKTGLGHEHGVEGRIQSGALRLNARQEAGAIVFDMRSFTADTEPARRYLGLEGTTSPSTRQQVEKNMLGKDVLHVAKYPTATFQIDSSRTGKNKQGKPILELRGNFTLHGTTRPLTIVAQLTNHDGFHRVRGEFTIRQTDFGMTPYSAALGTVGVADPLKIYGDLWIAADPPVQD